jgi:hypothetical protein
MKRKRRRSERPALRFIRNQILGSEVFVDFTLMTEEELEQIQSVCREWLLRPETSKDSCMVIPAGGALSRAIELNVSALLTFDNALIMSANDSETGVCYAKLIRQADGLEEVFNTPLEKIAADSVASGAPKLPLMRATQRRYQEAMDRLVETQQADANAGVPSPVSTNDWWIEKATCEADQLPKYLLYSNGKLLGYSMLERVLSDGKRSGRFHASEEYFEYADIFEAFPEAENDCLEASVQEAYGIFEEDNEVYRKKFAQLSAQVDVLGLYVEEESGHRLEASEVRLEDLSHKYDDQTERWLYVTINREQSE